MGRAQDGCKVPVLGTLVSGGTADGGGAGLEHKQIHTGHFGASLGHPRRAVRGLKRCRPGHRPGRQQQRCCCKIADWKKCEEGTDEAVTKGWTRVKSVLYMESEKEEETRERMLPWKPGEKSPGEKGQQCQLEEGMTKPSTLFCFVLACPCRHTFSLSTPS